MKSVVLRAIAFVSLLLSHNTNGFALTLDEFLGDGVATSTIVGMPATTVTTNSSAVGGTRSLYALKSSPGAGVTRLETFADPEYPGDPDYSLGYTQGAHTGQGIMTWDGDANPALAPNGLGTLDLTQDGGTAVDLGVKFFDYPSGQAFDVTVRLYDTTDPIGFQFSEVTITLNQAMSFSQPYFLSVPFATFLAAGSSSIAAPGGGAFATVTTFGPAGAVDLSKVGAIQLILNGLINSNAPDVTLDVFKTNGRCALVPDANGRVVDECGVCLDDPNANKGKDPCGICLFGPPPYVYHSVIDDCGLCPSAPTYARAKDPCGVCFGDGSTCSDCTGTPNGGAKIDACGVCGGNGTTCRDCLGILHGTAGLDLCGVCAGDGKSCVDCRGVPNGTTKLDACGTCGGNVTDPAKCARIDCVTVTATEEILDFQRDLVTKARAIRSKFRDADKRARARNCQVDSKPANTRVQAAFDTITLKGREIFTKGVEVCGNSCVTVSYAEEVKELTPQFNVMIRETKRLVEQGQKCYRRLNVKSTGAGKAGIAQTITDVRTGLTQLIKKCREQKICP